MKTENAYPPVRNLLAQQGDMVLLEGIEHHDSRGTTCRARAGVCEWLLGANGALPAWALIEFMAQCIAVAGNLAARERGDPVHPGLLLGSRTLHFEKPFIDANTQLQIVARPHRLGNLASFDCEATNRADDAMLAKGRLNVLRLPHDAMPPGEAAE